MTKRTQGNLMLLCTAIIWGMAFVAQSVAMDYVGAFTFLASRSILAGLAMIPVVLFFQKKNQKSLADPGYECTEEELHQQNRTKKLSMIGGFACGAVLCISSSFQQVGLIYTTAGKAGFITALYVVIVPVLGVFAHKKLTKMTWICAAIAVIGFYFLCINQGFSLNRGDVLMLCCAFCFSVHIMVVDYYMEQGADGVRMSCMQFFVCGFIALLMAFYTEQDMFSLSSMWDARYAILYAGLCSSAIGYTLQIMGQQYTEPSTASLLMSLESVFAAIGGVLILNEVMSIREIIGCLLVFTAVILAQVSPSNKG